MAARAPARRPACDSAAATAHRRVPRAPGVRTARARARANRDAGPSAACRSPFSANRDGMVPSVKSRGSQRSTSSHAERRRDARVGGGPHRIRAGDRAVFRVLVVVEKDAVPLFLPPFARRQAGRAPLDLSRHRQRGPAHLVERPPPFDAHVDVHAAGAGRLQPADQPAVVERGTHDARHVANLRPRDARHGVEVDAQLVRMIEVVAAHRVRVQFEAGEVGHPRERGGIARDHLLGGPSRRKTQGDHLNPRRPGREVRASGRRTRRRCRSDSGRARWAARPRLEARRPRRPGSTCTRSSFV